MHGLYQSGQSRDEFVIPGAQTAGGGTTQGVHFRDLRNDQSGAALGTAFDIGQVCLTHRTVVVPQGRAHGRHDDAVG
jgi:hypothetical protein